MARRLGAWIGGAVLLCVLIGVVYLPPRGMPKWAEGRLYWRAEPNQQRIRARGLAAEWREANAELLGAQYHERVGPALVERRNRGQPGPVLDLQAADSIRSWAVPVIQGALDEAWKRLDIGVSKVSVGVLVREGPRNSPISGPRVEYNSFGASYLLPDSSQRSTCLVVASLPTFAVRRRYEPQSRLADWGAGVLGPCAWYAKFGVPSARLERWLSARQFDVAMAAVWYRPSHDGAVVDWMFRFGDGPFWWWGALYAYDPQTLACYAGRPEACRRGFAAYDQPAGSRSRVVSPFDPWDSRKVKLVGAQVFLSDLLRNVGDERFRDFWTSDLPVDSSLTLALHRPVGEYTVSWMHQFAAPPHFGAATTWLNAALGLVFVSLLIGLVVLGQGRREVR